MEALPILNRILIANRGEIAVRVIRACRDLGLSPAVVYSEADRESQAVRLADRAVAIGPAPASESYLSIERIIQAAQEVGAQAVHPGYGFLAENYRLVEACRKAGLVFIGPPASAIRLMGDKISSRRTVVETGVAVVPGSSGSLTTPQEALEVAERIGYPILLKARAGGGGKGMRKVDNPKHLGQLFAVASGEAASAFGDATLYLEKYIGRPRHIEVQVAGDHHGHLVHLGERECSIQRRHQKLVEECPSPRVGEEFRRQLGEAALAAARAVGYFNLGTVEFLVDGSVEDPVPPFYFLEMNTRLQVEHPVTEMVTGIDLVALQIEIASGKPLPFEQSDISWSGWALECRIYAEDPSRNFIPSPGRLTTYQEPNGPGIRNDSGVSVGSTIPLEYDPLISKLIATGPDRPAAIARMRRALSEFRIGGVRTTIPFFEKLLTHPRFLSGQLHTHFIEQEQLDRDSSGDPTLAVLAAAVEHVLAGPAVTSKPQPAVSRWKDSGRPGLDFLD